MEEYTNYSRQAITFRDYLLKVFSTMALGVGISAVVAIVIDIFLYQIVSIIGYSAFTTLVLVSCGAELVVAILFSARLTKISKATAWTFYLFYSVLTGLSIGTILQSYTTGVIAFAFISATILFVCMAVIGHTTHLDLSKFSTILVAGLFAIIITSLLNVIFFRSIMVNYLISVAGVMIFLVLTAYDIQKLRNFYEYGSGSDEMNEKLIIYGAFQLYLDFINIFLRLLQIFGNSRRRSN